MGGGLAYKFQPQKCGMSDRETMGESDPVQVRSQDFSRCKGLALRGDGTKVDMVFNSKELHSATDSDLMIRFDVNSLNSLNSCVVGRHEGQRLHCEITASKDTGEHHEFSMSTLRFSLNFQDPEEMRLIGSSFARFCK